MSATFYRNEESHERLLSVHPVLRECVLRIGIDYPGAYLVVEGARSIARQKELVAKGVSKTYNSLHLVQPDGFAHAVDLVRVIGWDVKWGEHYAYPLSRRMKDRFDWARGWTLEWGGDWRTFQDSPHFQIRPVVSGPAA